MTGQESDVSSFAIIRGADRALKPRETGLTIVADRGYGAHRIADLIETAGPHVDWVKFAIGHWRVLPEAALRRKIRQLRDAGIGVFLAGDASEAAWLQGVSGDSFARAIDVGSEGVEVSSAQVLMPTQEKLRLVEQAAATGLKVVAEAGRKGSDPRPSLHGGIIREIDQLRGVGPWRVLVQAEGITAGTSVIQEAIVAAAVRHNVVIIPFGGDMDIHVANGRWHHSDGGCAVPTDRDAHDCIAGHIQGCCSSLHFSYRTDEPHSLD